MFDKEAILRRIKRRVKEIEERSIGILGVTEVKIKAPLEGEEGEEAEEEGEDVEEELKIEDGGGEIKGVIK